MGVYKGVKYDEDKDYKRLINESVANGDYIGAGHYERARNAKIDDMKLDYGKTYDYEKYIKNDIGDGILDAMKSGASANEVRGRRELRDRKTDLPEYSQYKGDWIDDKAAAYIELYDKVNAPFSYDGGKAQIDARNREIDEMMKELRNYKEFSYNPETDPMYAALSAQYTRNGQRAMQDTAAQLAARTGGLASSYAATAGNQAYANYMSELGDRIPELSQLAYNMYNDEYNRKLNEANMARDRLDSDIAQYNNERNFAYGQYADEKNMAYTQLQNLISGLRYADETEYNRGQNDVANEIAQGHLANETASTNSNIAVNAQNIAASQAGVELANKEFDASEDQRAKENKQTAYNNVMQLVREGKIPDDASIEAAGFDKAYVTGLAKEYADPIARAEKNSAIESAINYAINAGYVPDEIKKQSGMSDEEVGRYTALYADSKNKETRANAQTQVLNLVTNGYSAGNIPTDVKKNSGWTDAEINAMAQVGISEDAKNDKESAQAWISDWVFNGMSAASVPADILKASGWNLATVQRMVTDRKSATGNSSSASSTSGRSGGQSSKGGNNSAQVKEKKTDPVQVKETNRTQNGSYTGVDIGLGNEKYAPPSQPEVDMASVLALGRGLLSAETLANLISSGEIEQYTEDGKIKFRNRQKPGIIGMKPGGFGI